MALRTRNCQFRLSDADLTALDAASSRYGLARSQLLRCLIAAAASEAAPDSVSLIFLDRTTGMRLYRAVRSLGYLMNQSTRALNGIAKSCRTQEIESQPLEEVLRDTKEELQSLEGELLKVEAKFDELLHERVIWVS